MTVEIGNPRPPSNEVPASTTTATEGSSKESPWKAVGWFVIPANKMPAKQ